MCSANLEKRRKLALDSELTNVMLKDSQLVQPEGDDGKDTSEPAAEFRPKPCCTLGICICQGANKDVAFFISNLKMYFRRLFACRNKIKTEARKLLDQYSIVFQLDWAKPRAETFDTMTDTAPGGEISKSADDDDVSPELESLFRDALALPPSTPEPQFSSLYFHIGWINLQTVHFSVLQLCRLDNHQPSSDEGLSDVQVLTPVPIDESNDGIYTFTEAVVKLMDLHFAWKVSVLQFVCEYGGWCLHHDGSVAVGPIPDVPAFVVWQGSAAESQRRAVTRRVSAKQAQPGNRKRSQAQRVRQPVSSSAVVQQAKKRMKTTDSGKQQLEAAADRDELLLLIEEINNQEQGEAGEDLDDDDSASLAVDVGGDGANDAAQLEDPGPTNLDFFLAPRTTCIYPGP